MPECGPFQIIDTAYLEASSLETNCLETKSVSALRVSSSRYSLRLVSSVQPLEEISSTPCVCLSTPPIRNHDCKNYSLCLRIAASLNWDNFACQNCSGENCSGEIDQSLLWRAQRECHRDSVVRKICNIPPITVHSIKNGAEDHIKETEYSKTAPQLVPLEQKIDSASQEPLSQKSMQPTLDQQEHRFSLAGLKR